MKIQIDHECTNFDSYRSAYVKSLFNVDSGANFSLEAELPIEERDWQIGVIVGPSGSGKTSIGNRIAPGIKPWSPRWARDKPIVDQIAPKGSVNDATGALSAVGLGSVPSWLRPYQVLSNGEKFRADLARLLCKSPDFAVVDEFSSVVDRQVAKIAAGAFAKSWRRSSGQVVLLSCHYDILRWIQPDWVFDTGTGEFNRRRLRRPQIKLDIYQTDWRFWKYFEPHHYLKLPRATTAINYIGVVDGQLVAHVAISTRPGFVEARACRLVVMPDWQGAGVGTQFLNAVCDRWAKGDNRYKKPMPTLINTSHPGLVSSLRGQERWTQVSAVLYGSKSHTVGSRGLNGGHFRGIQGFRYLMDDQI